MGHRWPPERLSMPDILIVKDSSTLIPKIGITAQERTTWMMDFAIYDIGAAGQKLGPYGPLNAKRKTASLSVEVDGAGAPIRTLTPEGSLIAYADVAVTNARPTIAGFGDSFLNQGWYGWRAPWGRAESTTLSGIQYIGMERKASNSAHTLSYNASDRSCSFDGGPSVPLVDGFQIIPGPTELTGCAIIVRTAILSASNGTLTCTRSGTRPDEAIGGNSALYWFGILSNQGYVVRGYGHSGGWSMDGPSIIARAEDFDAFILNYHTNDIQGGSTLAQLQARTIVNLEIAYAKARAKKGIVNGCCPFRSGWTTAQSEIADAFNRWLPGALKAYPGVVARFPWARLISEAGNAANTALMNVDNVHPDDPAAQLAGKDWADYFGSVLPGTPIDFGSALGVYSATNLSGNRLLNPNPAGDTSGRPTGWNALSVDANGSATVSKVARTDGVAGSWARITGSATADGATHSYTLPQALFVGAPANGDIVQAFVEVRVSGAGQMLPYLVMPEIKGGSVVAYCRANNSASKALALSDWTGVIALPPYVWSDNAGTPGIDLRVGQRLLNGASGAILDIGRIWVGTPAELTIA